MTSKPPRVSAPETKGVLIRWASWYDVVNRWIFLGREGRFREWTVDLAGIAPDDTVLDVGCGTGNLTMAAKRRVGAGGEVHGIDAAPEMIQLAERKAANTRLDIGYQVGLIEQIPFPDGTYDIVLSSLMLHHLPKDLKRQGIAQVARVLKPGGRFVAVAVDLLLMPNLTVAEEAMRANRFVEIRRGRTPFRTALLRIHYLTGKAASG